MIVGRVKDNWKHAHLRGSSQLHILDKFSISLNCERRIVDSDDPSLPNAVVSGTLPKLVVHINEDKVNTLQRMARLVIGEAAAASGGGGLDQSCQTEDVVNVMSEAESLFPPPPSAESGEGAGRLYFCAYHFCLK